MIDLTLIIESREHWISVYGYACDLWWDCILHPGHKTECRNFDIDNTKASIKWYYSKNKKIIQVRPRKRIFNTILNSYEDYLE